MQEQTTERPPYPNWVGVVFSFIINGAAHYMSGHRTAGIMWHLGLALCGISAMAISAVPGIPSLVIGGICILVMLALWLVMMKQSYRPLPRLGLKGWLIIIVLNVVLGQLWSTILQNTVLTFEVPTRTMSPTLEEGDQIFVERMTKRARNPQRGDIVLFRVKGKPDEEPSIYIKRVAGLPGETISIDPPNLLVNGRPVRSPEIFRQISSAAPPFEGFALAKTGGATRGILTNATDQLVLGDDEYFVLGDSIWTSKDSRYWGALPKSSIVGRATRVYWPTERVEVSLIPE